MEGFRVISDAETASDTVTWAQSTEFLEATSHTPTQNADDALCCLAQELQHCNSGLFNELEAPPSLSPAFLSLAPHSPARVAQGDLGHGS